MPCVDPRKAEGIAKFNNGIAILSFAAVIRNIHIDSVYVHSLVVYWGSACLIISGILSAGTASQRNPCLVKSALVMNLISIGATVIGGVLCYVDTKNMPLDLKPVPACDDTDLECNLKFMSFLYGIRILIVLYFIEFCTSIHLAVLVQKARG